MNCHKNKKLLSAYLDRMLDKQNEEKVKKHLDSCTECRKIIGEMETVRGLLGRLEKVEPERNFETQILSRIEEKKPKVFSIIPFPKYLSYGISGVIVLLVVFSLFKKPVTQTEFQIAKAPEPIHETKKEVPAEVPFPTSSFPKTRESIPTPLSSPLEGEDSGEGEDYKTDAEEPITLEDRKNEVIDKVELDLSKPASEKSISEEKQIMAKKTSPVPPAEYVPAETGSGNLKGKASLGYSTVASSRIHPASPPNIIIRNNKDWGKVWNVQNTVQNLSLPVPKVDFKNQMVIAVPSRKENIQYEIIKTEEQKDKIIVQYKESKDKIIAPPPYQIKIVNSKPEVEFQKIN